MLLQHVCGHFGMPLQWRHNGAMVSQITSLTIVYSTVYSHGWPSTQPGTCTQPCTIVDTAVPPLFTQPCPGRTMSTAVCIYLRCRAVCKLPGCVEGHPWFRRRSKKTSKLRFTGLCVGNSPVTGEFPAQRASNAENVSIWWRHHGHALTS